MAPNTYTISVLVVEDDPGDALLIREMLDERGVSNTHFACRLADGIDSLDRARHDVILLDMGLPDSTGMNTLISFLAKAPHLPIVILTGYADEQFAMQAVRHGAQDYLIKSEIDAKILERALRYAIERKKLELALKKANEELTRLAATDTLTGAFNRLKINELLPSEIRRTIRHGVPLALIMFDIDHFKRINDTYGHLAGDYILRDIVAMMRKNIREHDALARWGGEEFMIVAPHCNLECAGSLAEKLRHMIESAHFRQGQRVTASFGVTVYQEGDTQESLTGRADALLYQAKDMGRNRVMVFQAGPPVPTTS